VNHIIPIPAFKDNYIWAMVKVNGTGIAVIDPGDAKPVLTYLHNNQLSLNAILITHHHWDHSGGIAALSDQFKNIPVYGPASENIPGLTHPVKEGDIIALPAFALSLNVYDIPGHTLGHVAYYGSEMLFCGDTLFSCGCGRLFEGTPTQMVASLDKIKKLPLNTQIYCGHEYTLANLAFAQTVEPQNAYIAAKIAAVKSLRAQNYPTLPVTLASELQTNPFLRCTEPTVIKAVEQHTNLTLHSPIDVFTHLRAWKDQFVS